MIELLPHVNASLNLTASLLLATGFVLIKNRCERAHKVCMLSAFGVSVVFLACYVVYHLNAGSKTFPTADYPAVISVTYFVVLATHVVLAIVVPFLAVSTIYLGVRDRREQHRKLARWTFPIWMYVSVTGVLVYLMLYWWFLPNPTQV